jgi:adenylosuccinate lyase/3-carboxy-cis,cis-muconate cycloisomerase
MLIENEGFAAHSNVNDVTLPEAAICAASLAAGLRHLMAGIKVDAAAMKANLEITGGQIMSEAVMMLLARHLGRHRAHEILHQAVSRANESGVGLLEAIRQDPRVVDLALERQIAAMLDVSTYLGESGEIAQGLPSA